MSDLACRLPWLAPAAWPAHDDARRVADWTPPHVTSGGCDVLLDRCLRRPQRLGCGDQRRKAVKKL